MRFSSKSIFNLLFILAISAVVWVGALFVHQMIVYSKFSYHTVGRAVYWGVMSLSEESNRVYVDYTYAVDDKSYFSRYVFPKPIYKSKEAAEYAKEVKSKESIDVWYALNAAHQEPRSIAEREWPVNEAVRLAIAFLVLAYFYFLRRYLYHFSTPEEGSDRGGEKSKLPS